MAIDSTFVLKFDKLTDFIRDKNKSSLKSLIIYMFCLNEYFRNTKITSQQIRYLENFLKMYILKYLLVVQIEEESRLKFFIFNPHFGSVSLYFINVTGCFTANTA